VSGSRGTRAAAAGVLVALALAPVAPAKLLGGTPGDDRLGGTRKADKLIGRGGNDTLLGRKGGDLILGGRGNDKITGGKGFDEIRGGSGREVIRARDGHPDYIDCGKGKEVVYVDAVEDGVFNCKRVVEPPAEG
jgi:Ca2+-binding RTX toxin-like protein